MKILIFSTLINLSLAGAAFAEACGARLDGTATTAEIVEFRLVDGAIQEQFLTSAQATTEYLCETEGFVRRSLSRDETGLWTDYVEWTSPELAKMAAEAAMQREDMMPFMMAIDPETISLRYADISTIE
ncbi:MAG: hypothetical protein ABJO67_19415 [Pseudoruegeria sp.]